MVKSMTGYGSVQKNTPDFQLLIEVKTLNSKSFDCRVNFPEILSPREFEIRNLAKDMLIRGKVNISFSFEFHNPEFEKRDINKPLFLAYCEEFKSLSGQANLQESDVLSVVARLREVYKEPSKEIDDQVWETIKNALQEALVECDKYRIQEGEALKKALLGYLNELQQSKTFIDSVKDERIKSIKERISEKLNELSGAVSDSFDPGRLEQEMVYYTEKLDITEESVRLDSHFQYFEKMLEKNDGGKSLNFLCQELNREVNTIGSKANDVRIQHEVVKMKESLDKIREQVLNVL